MRSLFAPLAFAAVLAMTAAPAAHAAPNDAQVAQALVGSWVYSESIQGTTIAHQLTLTAAGEYVMTSVMVGTSYQVTSSGRWGYQDGWLMFQVVTSQPLDPTGRPIGLPPARIIEVGPNHIRTPAGIARRVV